MSDGYFALAWQAKTSDPVKEGAVTLPSDVGIPSKYESLHYCWSMPWRIRLLAVDGEAANAICAESRHIIFTRLPNKKTGINYDGAVGSSTDPISL